MTQPIETLRVCFPFTGDTVGGSHLSVAALIEALPSGKVEPIVALHEDGPLAPYLENRGISHVRAPAVAAVGPGSIAAQIMAMARCAPPLATFLRRQSIDIVHTNDARMHLTWGPAARLAGCRFVWHQRSADDSRRNAQYSRIANKILTISQYCKQAFPAPMSAQATVVVEPFDTAAPAPESSSARKTLLQTYGAPADAKIVGYVGNLTQQKRPLVFLETARRLQDRSTGSFVFPMFGEAREPMEAMVEARIGDLGLRDVCRLMGPRYPIEPWIAACDVLVAPAVHEGLGRTLVEAMLVGIPVVAADDAGHREILDHGQTGLLVPPDNPEAFANAIAELLAREDYAHKLTLAAGDLARRRFSACGHAKHMQDIYRELVT